MSYEEERFDLTYLLKKIIGNNDIETIGDFKLVLSDYINYVEKVVQHVTYEFDFRKYGGNQDRRDTMEEYNSDRTFAHNNAIKSTLDYNEKTLKRYGMVFCEHCLGKKKIEDFSAGERSKIGDFIFSTIATCSSLTRSEREQIGGNIEEVLRDVSMSTSRVERNYQVDITNNPDDIYKSLR